MFLQWLTTHAASVLVSALLHLSTSPPRHLKEPSPPDQLPSQELSWQGRSRGSASCAGAPCQDKALEASFFNPQMKGVNNFGNASFVPGVLSHPLDPSLGGKQGGWGSPRTACGASGSHVPASFSPAPLRPQSPGGSCRAVMLTPGRCSEPGHFTEGLNAAPANS